MISILRNKHIMLALRLHHNGMLAIPFQHAKTLFTSTKYLTDSPKIPRGKTPIGKLDQTSSEKTTDPEVEVPDPYAPFPDGKNPTTGEVGGPRGPEPTRYGDWERKGRVSDF